MLKTIKTTKQMRLDELIKYVWDNSVNEKRVFLSNHGQRVVFDNVGGFYPSGYAYSPDSTFTVEVEEPITEDTEFDCILEIRKGSLTHIRRRKTIKENLTEETERFYALINGHLELVWEADGE